MSKYAWQEYSDLWYHHRRHNRRLIPGSREAQIVEYFREHPEELLVEGSIFISTRNTLLGPDDNFDLGIWVIGDGDVEYRARDYLNLEQSRVAHMDITEGSFEADMVKYFREHPEELFFEGGPYSQYGDAARNISQLDFWNIVPMQ